jgi:very-short-patch-repair endonuclease/tRNA A37 threonylcarbamoyladenosine biosynthesis protein TsaE
MTYKENEIQEAVSFFKQNACIESGKRIFGLSGNLGAGKTTFVKALLKSLGVTQNVVSPTFVLRRDYEASPPTPLLQRGEGVQSFLTGDKNNINSLKKISKDLRSNQTDAEEVLWECLRDSKLGYKFRRQHVVGNFIADFICLPQKLVIEIDGGIHNRLRERDAERTQIFYALGFKVVRFTNEEVKKNVGLVVERILRELAPFSEGEGPGMRHIKNIIHIDAYRLETHSQIYQVVTKEELADKNNLILVEWPEKVDMSIFDRIFLFEHVSETERKISIKSV